MTVDNTKEREIINCDGSTTTHNIGFYFLKDDDLKCYHRSAAGVETTIVPTAVVGAGSPSGGTVTFANAYVVGDKIHVIRDPAPLQETKLENANNLPPTTVEVMVDRLYMLHLAQEGRLQRTVQLPTTYSGASLTLPEPDGKETLIGYNASGQLVVHSGISTLALEAKTARDEAVAAASSVSNPLDKTQNLADLTDKAVARTNLGALSTADLASIESQIGLIALRQVIDAGWSVTNYIDGFADEFNDETGIDGAASSNQIYDAAGDYYHNTVAVSDQTSGQTFTASSSAQAVSRAFDDNSGTCWTSNADDTAWVQVQFAAAKDIRELRISSGSDGFGGVSASNARARHPRGFTLKASNTGVFGGEEVTLLTVAETGAYWNTGADETKTWNFSNGTAYTHYRITMTDKQDAFGATYEYLLAEVEMMEAGTPANMVVASNAITAAANPSSSRLVVLHEPVDAVTLNTDFTAEMSDDGGTTWASGTLSDEGVFSGNTKILTASFDLSGTTGTAIKYRLTTANNKGQKVHGVWGQWS